MISWLWLIPAVQVGVMIGIFIAALMQMARTPNEGDVINNLERET